MFFTSYTRYFGFGIIVRFMSATCQLKPSIQTATDYKEKSPQNKPALFSIAGRSQSLL
jgi:hypothetical protein